MPVLEVSFLQIVVELLFTGRTPILSPRQQHQALEKDIRYKTHLIMLVLKDIKVTEIKETMDQCLMLHNTHNMVTFHNQTQ